MLDYIFFHQKPFQLFIEFLKEHNVPAETKIDDENFEIAIAENISDELLDLVDNKYEELMDLNQQISENQEAPGQDNYTRVSISFKLKDGTTSNAMIDRKLMAKVMSVLSNTELTAMIDAIVSAVENPEHRSICEQMRSGDRV